MGLGRDLSVCDRPLLILVKDHDIRIFALCEISLIKVIQLRRIHAHLLHKLHGSQVAFLHKLCHRKAESSLKTDNSARCFPYRKNCLFLRAVRSVVGGNHIDRAVLDSFNNSLAVLCGSKGRVHLRHCAMF